MMINVLLAVAAMQALPAPDSIRWEPIAEDIGGRYEIDTASPVRDGDLVRFLVHAFAARPEADGSSIAVARYVIDCRQRLSAVAAADMYNAEGGLVKSVEVPTDRLQFAPVGQSSSEGRFYNRVCPAARP